MYVSTKLYRDLGPVAYRQWRADSHCNLIHGYSLSFKFTFEAELELFKGLERRGIAKLTILPALGCEALAKMIYEVAEQWLLDAGQGPRVRLRSVEVMEHGANSAIYERE